MKSKTKLRTIIRKIVREEVAMAINEVITELKQPTQQTSKPKVVEGKRIYKKYSENAVINDVLNETAQSDDWKQLGNGTFDSSKVNEVMQSSYGDMMNNTSTNTDGSLARQMGVSPEDPAADFLNKDYSKIMKAIDKKKKNK